MSIRTCVTPEKRFVYGIHKPAYTVEILRDQTNVETLGHLHSGEPYSNETNFPQGNVAVAKADWIFEIPNPLSFRGSTYIDKEWADASAKNPERISLSPKKDLSLSTLFKNENIDKT